jgi:KUP system potassium uptake protein
MPGYPRDLAVVDHWSASLERSLARRGRAGGARARRGEHASSTLSTLLDARGALRQPEEDLIETAVSRCHARLPGTAIFLASTPNGVPLALTQFVKHNHCLHQRVILVTVLIAEQPRIADEDRAEVIEIIEGITRVILHYGFMQYPTIYEGLTLACRQGKLPGIDLTDITYYIGRETIIPREDIPGMWLWRETIFAFLQRNAERTAAFFDVPARQVVEFGTEIEI